MKTIVAVNTAIPSVDHRLGYTSGATLRDYDIVVFDPELPDQRRIEFTTGGSAVDIEGLRTLQKSMQHWQDEITNALTAGKTVFFLLNEFVEDRGAVGGEANKGSHSYSLSAFNNYFALPVTIRAKNTKGKTMVATGGRHKALLSALGPLAGYKVILEGTAGEPILTAKDGAVVGSIVKLVGLPGHLVLLPHFDFIANDRNRDDTWTDKSMQLSAAVVEQLVAIDRSLTTQSSATPTPAWMAGQAMPSEAVAHDSEIARIDTEVAKLAENKAGHLEAKRQVMRHTRLLYENGKPLESAVEQGLRVLGFTVENYRDGDLEIDHVIVGPSGIRMIGESEGKDTSAIDISKFRQLESNIQEDFQRDGVEEHAKGVLFGNGHRLTEPASREEQFTAKCFTNAKRLGTALVRTSDLYAAVIYALDHPTDEEFKSACREAIETTSGDVVVFPKGEPAGE